MPQAPMRTDVLLANFRPAGTVPSPKRSPACGEERVVSCTLDSHVHTRPAKTGAVLHCPCADVLIYLISLANLLEVDLLQAAEEKLALNARKYPVDKARGSCARYDEL